MRRSARLLVDVARGRTHPRDALEAALPSAAPRRPAAPVHDPDAPALVLSPHLDDAVLSCWHVLSGPGDVTVANVFTAPPPDGVLTHYDRVAGASASAAMMARRLDEDRAALGRAGREPLALGLLESAYRRRAPATGAIAAALGAQVGRARMVHAPAAIAGHPDHVLVRDAALRLARAGVPVRLYADLPYCVAYGWPSWVTGGERDPHLDVDAHWAPALETLRADGWALAPEVVRLDADAQAAKLAALRDYATQYATLTRGPLDVLASPLVLGFEVTWSLAPRDARGGTTAP
ncbi:MAG TPA: hypothetical protein VM266_11340 [Solirubrobacteraceae bacterium]|nr:hypothetical protein [Solirubrobacteraceae bacterium]